MHRSLTRPRHALSTRPPGQCSAVCETLTEIPCSIKPRAEREVQALQLRAVVIVSSSRAIVDIITPTTQFCGTPDLEVRTDTTSFASNNFARAQA